MRSFNWDAIPKHNVVGKRNIWTKEETRDDFKLDTKCMDELFSQDEQVPLRANANSRKSLRGLPASSQGSEMVSILNSKKSMNIGIFLKQFRRPVQEIVEDISQGSGQKYGAGKLQELVKLLPEDGEVKKLRAFKGDLAWLSEADLFMVLLVKVPSYKERLQGLVLQEEFSPFIENMKQSISVMTNAAKELLDCNDLHTVIRLVLKMGNYMNAGGYAGSAVGFRMTSLLKLADTKANKPGMNLMHYVVMQAQQIDMSLLKLPDQLKHIGPASRIFKQEVEMEFNKEVKQVADSKANAKNQKDLQEQMESFLKEAEDQLAEVEISLQALNSVSHSVAEYFCEDPNQFRLEECCSIFHSFCDKFMRAIQENRDRELVEVKRRQRERLNSASKRKSTATCSHRDKDMEGVALESILQRFIRGSSRRKLGTPSPNGGSLPEVTIPENINDNQSCDKEGLRNPINDVEMHENGKDLIKDPAKNSLIEESPLQTGKEQSSGRERIPSGPGLENMNSVPVSKKQNRQSRTPSAMSNTSSDMDRNSISGTGDEEGNNAEHMREVSRKVLKYQNSRGSLISGDQSFENLGTRSPNGTSTSPCLRDHREDRHKAVPEQSEDLTPRTILSPPASHFTPGKNSSSITRRHTLTALPTTPTGNREDNIFFFPDNFIRTPTPMLSHIGKMKSADCWQFSEKLEEVIANQHREMTSTDSKIKSPSQRRIMAANHCSPVMTPKERLPSVSRKEETSLPSGKRTGFFKSRKAQGDQEKERDAIESSPSFRLGDFLQRKFSQKAMENSPKPAESGRPESSTIFSFFRRFNEKTSKPSNKQLDSESTDLFNAK